MPHCGKKTGSVIMVAGMPAAGAYAHAHRAAGLLFLSAQGPTDWATGAVVGADVAAQFDQCLANCRAVLHAAGLDLGDVAKVVIYLADLEYCGVVDQLYGQSFAAPLPARSMVGARLLPRGSLVELELIAADRNVLVAK